MEGDTPVHYLNVAYFFRLIYEAVTGFGGTPSGGFAALIALMGQVWIMVTVLAYLISFGALIALVYFTTRANQVKHHEEHRLASTLAPAEAEKERDHSRWDHVMELIESMHENDWRQAIIEADIMLFDLLEQLGYQGDSVAERLKQAKPDRFQTLQNAWEAHKIRNEIAHQGSAYKLDDNLAYRTIGKYESVMREFGEI